MKLCTMTFVGSYSDLQERMGEKKMEQVIKPDLITLDLPMIINSLV